MNLQELTQRRGTFLTFEGIDGAGKSSHLSTLARRLREGTSASNVIVTREPGGTPLAERLREMVLSSPMDPLTETLLCFAARRDHVTQLIEPALARGQTVICDRFTDSTFAYQGGGRRLDIDRLKVLEEWVHGSLQPDLTLWFDVEPETAARRRAGVRLPDRFEELQIEFFVRVRNAYIERMNQAPDRFVRIDASQSPEAVWLQVEAAAIAQRQRTTSSATSSGADPMDTRPDQLERGLSCSDGS